MASMMDVMKYFEIKPSQFRAEWKDLSDESKEQLKNGVADGTLTY